MADFEGWRLAGYGLDDDWYDVENGDVDVTEGELTPDGQDLVTDIDEVVVAFTDANGVDHYYTLYGPWDSWDDFYDYVDDIGDQYEAEAA